MSIQYTYCSNIFFWTIIEFRKNGGCIMLFGMVFVVFVIIVELYCKEINDMIAK